MTEFEEKIHNVLLVHECTGRCADRIIKIFLDTFLKAIPKKMKEAPGNIAYRDQAAAVKGAYNNAIDRMLINFEKELGVKI